MPEVPKRECADEARYPLATGGMEDGMSFCDDLAEETAAEQNWLRHHPPRGARFTLHGLEFIVANESPLRMRGPSGVTKDVPAQVLARMEMVR